MNALKPIIVTLTCLLASTLGAHAEDASLVGHWTLSGDVKDHSTAGNHGDNHNVRLDVLGPRGESTGAGRFDGRTL